MDVLNTYGGEVSAGAITGAVIFGILALVGVVVAVFTYKARAAGGSLLFGLLAVWLGALSFFFAAVPDPIRHEVTLREGFVIDATKYEIIEQRGAIYVIKEREVPQP
jgi:hypothetical protein